MIEDLEEFIRKHTRFDPLDPLGKGRIRRLCFEYDQVKRKADRDQRENERVSSAQAEAVTIMVRRLAEVEERNRYLENYVKEADAIKEKQHKELQEQKATIELLADQVRTWKLRYFENATNGKDVTVDELNGE